MKILLLFPSITVGIQSVKKCDLPLGLAYIAAYLENGGHEVHVLDISLEGYENEKQQDGTITFGLNDEDIKEAIKNISPELIGISCPYSLQFHNVIYLSKLIKEVRDIPVVVGGVHVSFDAQNILKTVPTIDYIVMGEGETTVLDLVNGKALQDIDGLAYRKSVEVIVNRPRELIKNLDDIPFPARHLFNMEKYIKINKPHNHFPMKNRVTSMITSRGCYGQCNFCSSHIFWGHGLRIRSKDNIIEEMKILINEYGIQEIQIADDNLTGPPKKVKNLFKAMKYLGIVWCTPNGVRLDTIDEEMLKLMKESGCYRLTYAVESADEEILRKVIKKPYRLEKVKPLVDMTKRAGIGVHIFYIIGFPGETREKMQKTYEFAKYLKAESSSFCLATPMIGTDLLETCISQDLLRKGFDVNKANYREANIINPYISKEELENLCDYYNESINRGLLWRDPLAFFKKYHREIFRNPKGTLNLFKKFT